MRKSFCYITIPFILAFCFTGSLSADSKGGIKLNFNDVEILNIIKIMGKATGRTFIFNNKVLKGKRITLLSNQQFTSEEAYKIFESVLHINGLSTIDEGKVTRIVTSKEAKTSPVPMFDQKQKLHDGSYITRVIPVKNLKIRTVRSSLQPLISRNAVLVGNDDANILIMKDTRENTERFAEIVKMIDHPDNPITSMNLEIVPLSHADANETSGLLGKIFSSGAKKGASKGTKLRILADKRTNNLILIGPPESLEKIKQLVVQLDTEIEKDEGNIRVFPLKHANAKKVSEVLQKIANTLRTARKTKTKSGQATIIPDIPSNSLVIFADKADFPTLENVIAKLDVERAQVFIQALIMEVRLDKSLDMGVEWQTSALQQSGGTEALVTVGGVGATGQPKSLESIATNTGASGAMLGVIGGPLTFGGIQYSTFNAFIKALEQDTEIEILSNPQILTLNNEEAEIKVGEIVPTIGSTKVDSSGNTTTTIDYKDVGISMKITPQVNSNDSIELKIDETSSNVVEGRVGASEQGAITTLNRSIKTKVVVQDGQTIVLGGLVSDEVTDVETKTPCLGDIPILGWLFKTKSTSTKKTNLLVFLTPKVIRSPEDLTRVSEKAKLKSRNSRKGRFRIDVSKEFNIPVEKEDSETESESKE
ncbi:MAG: type II secretion system secretin GspD [Proteobacteria bacterium]|nr:type II secretion system secretin GspD [Pseudomonadota bacterium]